MNAFFLSKQKEVEDIWTFKFRPSHAVNYIAGQFVEITIPIEIENNEKPRRWFSLSSSPTETDFIAITTRISKNKPSRYKQQLFNTAVGSELNISEAMGDFVLPRDNKRLIVFIAIGIGITPYRSMIKYLTDTGQSRHINLYCLNRATETLPFVNVFSAAGYEPKLINFHRHIDKVTSGVQNVVDKILDKESKESLFYISGPEHAVEDLRKAFITNAIPESQVIGDYFPGY